MYDRSCPEKAGLLVDAYERLLPPPSRPSTSGFRVLVPAQAIAVMAISNHQKDPGKGQEQVPIARHGNPLVASILALTSEVGLLPHPHIHLARRWDECYQRADLADRRHTGALADMLLENEGTGVDPV